MENKELAESLHDITTVLAELPIPGLSEILGPFNTIMGMLEPDPLEKIAKNLETANNRLNNMYNVILGSLDKNDMEGILSNQKTHLGDIEDALGWIKTSDDEQEDKSHNYHYSTSTRSQYYNESEESQKTVRNAYLEVRRHFTLAIDEATSYTEKFFNMHAQSTLELNVFLGEYMFALEKVHQSYYLFNQAYLNVGLYKKYLLETELDDSKNWENIKTKTNIVFCNQVTSSYKDFIENTFYNNMPEVLKQILNHNFSIKFPNKEKYFFYHLNPVAYPNNSFWQASTIAGKDTYLQCDKIPVSNSKHGDHRLHWRFELASSSENSDSAKWRIRTGIRNNEDYFSRHIHVTNSLFGFLNPTQFSRALGLQKKHSGRRAAIQTIFLSNDSKSDLEHFWTIKIVNAVNIQILDIEGSCLREYFSGLSVGNGDENSMFEIVPSKDPYNPKMDEDQNQFRKKKADPEEIIKFQ